MQVHGHMMALAKRATGGVSPATKGRVYIQQGKVQSSSGGHRDVGPCRTYNQMDASVSRWPKDFSRKLEQADHTKQQLAIPRKAPVTCKRVIVSNTYCVVRLASTAEEKSSAQESVGHHSVHDGEFCEAC